MAKFRHECHSAHFTQGGEKIDRINEKTLRWNLGIEFENEGEWLDETIMVAMQKENSNAKSTKIMQWHLHRCILSEWKHSKCRKQDVLECLHVFEKIIGWIVQSIEMHLLE